MEWIKLISLVIYSIFATLNLLLSKISRFVQLTMYKLIYICLLFAKINVETRMYVLNFFLKKNFSYFHDTMLQLFIL